jgi:hypothetical protein
MNKEIDPIIYEVIYLKFEDMKNKLELSKKIKLFQKKAKWMTGTAYWKSIVLTDKLMAEYNKHPFVLYGVLGHELIHIKYQDSGLRRLIWNIFGTFGSKKANALILLMEIRADIEGIAVAGLSDEEISLSQRILKSANNGGDKKDTYKYGYPTREQIIYFANKYKLFDDKVAIEILNDFCDFYHIEKQDDFITEVLRTFNF